MNKVTLLMTALVLSLNTVSASRAVEMKESIPDTSSINSTNVMLGLSIGVLGVIENNGSLTPKINLQFMFDIVNNSWITGGGYNYAYGDFNESINNNRNERTIQRDMVTYTISGGREIKINHLSLYPMVQLLMVNTTYASEVLKTTGGGGYMSFPYTNWELRSSERRSAFGMGVSVRIQSVISKLFSSGITVTYQSSKLVSAACVNFAFIINLSPQSQK